MPVQRCCSELGGAPNGLYPSSSSYCSSSGSEPVASHPQSFLRKVYVSATVTMFSLPQPPSIFFSAVRNTFIRPNSKRLCYFTALRFLHGPSRLFTGWAHHTGAWPPRPLPFCRGPSHIPRAWPRGCVLHHRGACILMLLDVHSGFSLLDEITFAFSNYCFLDLSFQDKPHIFLSTEPPLMPLLSWIVKSLLYVAPVSNAPISYCMLFIHVHF